MTPVELTASIGVLILAGLLASTISFKYRIPEVLLLTITGILFGNIKYNNEPLLTFPTFFLAMISIFSLTILIFDSYSLLRWRFFDTIQHRALTITITFTIILGIFFSSLIWAITELKIITAIILSLLTAGTAFEFVYERFRGIKPEILYFIKAESIFGTAIVALVPILFINLLEMPASITKIGALIIISIGTGIATALILWKILHKFTASRYSTSALILGTIISYILGEIIGGIGVLSVSSYAIFFGNVYIKREYSIIGYPSVLSKFLYILLFGLLGIIIPINFDGEIIMQSIIIFIIYIIIRAITLTIFYKKLKYTARELLFMSLNAPKGGAYATTLFTIAIFTKTGIFTIPQIDILLELGLAIFTYSLIISIITLKIGKKILDIQTENKKGQQWRE